MLFNFIFEVLKSDCMKKYILPLLISVFAISCSQPNEKPQQEEKTNQEQTTEIKTFKMENGWGYDISRNGKPYIHQPNIPAVSGNFAFETEEDAQTIAKLVAYKITNNIIPPSVTVEELDSLGIAYKK